VLAILFVLGKPSIYKLLLLFNLIIPIEPITGVSEQPWNDCRPEPAPFGRCETRQDRKIQDAKIEKQHVRERL
jgi:hypothetical protein